MEEEGEGEGKGEEEEDTTSPAPISGAKGRGGGEGGGLHLTERFQASLWGYAWTLRAHDGLAWFERSRVVRWGDGVWKGGL